MMETLLLPVPYTQFVKPAAELILFEGNEGLWRHSGQESANAFHYAYMDNRASILDACQKAGAECIEETISQGNVIARIQGSPEAVDESRAIVMAHAGTLDKALMSVETLQVFSDISRQSLRQQFVDGVNQIAEFTETAVVVTRAAGDYELQIYGMREAVSFAYYKLRTLRAAVSGHALQRVELPLSLQPLIFGPNKTHLHTIFQQTKVNIFGPSLSPTPRNAEYVPWTTDEVYLTGDLVQIAVAERMLQEIRENTATFVKPVQIMAASLELLRQTKPSELASIMTHNATFIEFPNAPETRHPFTVRIYGANRSSVERTIERLMFSCMGFGSACVCLHGVNLTLAKRLHLDETALIALAGNAATPLTTNVTSSIHISGSLENLTVALAGLAPQFVDLIQAHSQYELQIVVELEASSQLKEFVAGKKSGKIGKVMAATQSYIWFSALHEYNFRINVAAKTFSELQRALKMLRQELPAERYLFIPEAFHKQIIGQGGSRIQGVMRNHNVFIKFGSCGDSIPNAFGRSQIDNVVIRCPAKNAASLEAAATELQDSVRQWSHDHLTTYMRLTRSQVRFLTTSRANVVAGIEKRNNVVARFPADTRSTELVEICGVGTTSQIAAHQIKAELPTDYEFRLAWSPKFADAVGPQSAFASRISAPFRIVYDAQVQAFEKVQMESDPSIYSQVVITAYISDREALEQMDNVLRAYLREQGLDIIDRGELHVEPIVEGTAAMASPLSTLSSQNQNRMRGISDSKYQTPFKDQQLRNAAVSFTASAGSPYLSTPVRRSGASRGITSFGARRRR